MNHDSLINHFKSLSDAQLAQVIRAPHQYTPEAFAIAEAEVNARQLSSDDIEQLALANITPKSKVGQAISKGGDFLEDLTMPQQEFSLARWWQIMLVILVLRSLFSLYSAIYFLVFMIRSGEYDLSSLLYTSFSIIYTPLLLWLLYKKSHWAWAMLLLDTSVSVMSYAMQLIFMFEYKNVIGFENFKPYYIVIAFVIAFLFTVFLLKRDLQAYFKVDKAFRNNIFVAIGAILLVLLGLWMMNKL